VRRFNLILFLLLKENADEIEIYNMHKEKLNFVQMAQSVHKLKHKISILGLRKVVTLLKNMKVT
jgi:hypothetical protein